GTPLSHGCVRLDEPTARKIFCGVRAGRSRVQVRGFARPRCDHPQLTREWESDIQYAARPTDGEDVSPILRRGILETRRMLESTFGRRNLRPADTGRLRAADVPHCTSRGAAPTADEARTYQPTTPGTPATPEQILAASGFDAHVLAFETALGGVGSLAALRRLATQQGRALWRAATTRAQAATGSTDDRPLY